MARKASLSGFPEWLPQERLVEQHVLDSLRRTFELHGFSSIETRAVETVGQLLRKGEIDKEVYGLHRLQADEADGGKAEDKLALHFDLTVPFARYVVENAGHLAFPFRRYQIQKVWRGERPQEGRAREFTQADIDVVGDGELPFRYDVELALVIVEALGALPIPEFKLRVNNRKLAEGFYRGIGLDDTAGVLRSIDKLEKVGPQKVAELLQEELGATAEQAEAALQLASIRSEDTSFVEQVRALGVSNELLDEGLGELEQVIGEAAHHWRSVTPRAGTGPGGPEHRPRTRLLHRNRLRNGPGGARTARLDLLRRPVRRPRRQGQPQVPRRGPVHRRDPASDEDTRPGARLGLPARAHRGAGHAG
jgi:histidyl-tRNA synthetase